MQEIENRRSVRKYENRAVEESKIAQLIESARLAPSGNNTQPWHFIVVDDSSIIGKIAATANNQRWITTAPLLIACVADVGVRLTGPDAPARVHEESPMFEVKQIIRDTTIAIEHIVLEATHAGLGSCWVCWYTQDEMRPVLGIPEDKFLVAILTVGYPAENPALRPRKNLESIVHRNAW